MSLSYTCFAFNFTSAKNSPATAGQRPSASRKPLGAPFLAWEYNPDADAALAGEPTLLDVPLLGKASQHAWLVPVFRKAQYNLMIVETTAQMLALLQERRYPAVISDMSLGDDSWRDLLRKLQAEPEAPHTIMLTEQVTASIWADVLVSGGFDVLPRSADSSLLLRSVNIACQRWHDTMLRHVLRRNSSLAERGKAHHA